MRRTSTTPILALTLATAACGLFGRGAHESEFGLVPSDSVTLDVQNQNYYDATLYAVWRNGRRTRLGRVSGNTRGTFAFRWESTEMQIEIRLLSVGSYFTQPMMVERGDALDLVIEPGLDRRIRLQRRGDVSET